MIRTRAASVKEKVKTNSVNDSFVTQFCNTGPMTRGVSWALASCTVISSAEETKTISANIDAAMLAETPVLIGLQHGEETRVHVGRRGRQAPAPVLRGEGAQQAPVDIVATLKRAIGAHQNGRFAEAETFYRAVLDRDANQFDALQMLGILEAQRGKLEEGRKLIARAVKANPKAAEGHSNLGRVLKELGRLDEALEWIARIKPKRAILTNLHTDMDYATLCAELPPGVEPGYDRMSFVC